MLCDQKACFRYDTQWECCSPDRAQSLKANLVETEAFVNENRLPFGYALRALPSVIYILADRTSSKIVSRQDAAPTYDG